MPPRIDFTKCDGCGTCVFQCGARVFGFDSERYRAVSRRPKDCMECFICEMSCRRQAISVKLVGQKGA